MKKSKKWVAAFLAAAIAAGAGFGGVTLLKNRGGEVNVYPADRFITSADWAANAQTDGIVSTDRIQSIYLSSTQVVTDVYVTEGQTVRAGDPILAFDTTLSEVNLYRQSIKVDQTKLDIENAEKELQKIDTYRIGTGSAGGYAAAETPAPTEAPLTPVEVMPYNRTERALGTRSDPVIYLWNEKSVFSAGFIAEVVALAQSNREAYLNGGEPVETATPVDPSLPTDTPEPTPTTEPTDTPEPTATPEPTPTAEPTDTPKPTEEPTPTPEPTEEPTPTPEPTEEPTATPEPTEEPTPTPEPTEEPPADGSALSAPAPVRPDSGVRLMAAFGRRLAPAETAPVDETPTPDPADTPAASAAPLDPAVVEEIADPEIYVVFEVRQSDALEGEVERVWEMAILVDAASGAWSFRMVPPEYDPGDDGELIPDETGFDDFYFDDTVYYTASEIAQMKAEVNQRLKDLRLELKMAELEYDRIGYELSNGEVTAKIDGVVKTLRDADEARGENKPMVLISGGGGYYVTAALGEFERDTMRVGDTVTVQSWESGEQVDGEITEISEYPDDSNRYWYYSEGNQNVSKYPFRVFVNEDANLRDGEGVTLTYSAAGTEGGSGIYLEMPFIRQENGKSYLYVRGDDGLLEKRFVTTGKNLWGSYLEILDGLTAEDYIAFPYGRGVKDGAKTREAEADELYAYY